MIATTAGAQGMGRQRLGRLNEGYISLAHKQAICAVGQARFCPFVAPLHVHDARGSSGAANTAVRRHVFRTRDADRASVALSRQRHGPHAVFERDKHYDRASEPR